MTPDPLRPPETDEEPWTLPPPDPLLMGREPDPYGIRDARLVLAAFAGMGILAVLAWAVQR
jgi:hypothetical protein